MIVTQQSEALIVMCNWIEETGIKSSPRETQAFFLLYYDRNVLLELFFVCLSLGFRYVETIDVLKGTFINIIRNRYMSFWRMGNSHSREEFFRHDHVTPFCILLFIKEKILVSATFRSFVVKLAFFLAISALFRLTKLADGLFELIRSSIIRR